MQIHFSYIIECFDENKEITEEKESLERYYYIGCCNRGSDELMAV